MEGGGGLRMEEQALDVRAAVGVQMCGGDAGDGGQARVREVQTGSGSVEEDQRREHKAPSSSRPTNRKLSQGAARKDTRRRRRASPAAGRRRHCVQAWAVAGARLRVRRRAAQSHRSASVAAPWFLSETPRRVRCAMDPPRSHSARRSYPNLNLHNLSLAPLSKQYPLDASAPPSPDEDRIYTPRTSYIAQKSAPTTPGILSLGQSRSSSRNGRRTTKPYAYDGYFINPDVPVRDAGDVPKAKSTTALLPGVSFADQPKLQGRHHVRKGTAPLPLRPAHHRHHTSESANEWFHRAGMVIAGETRDSKGQGWLVRRESSTSLVHQSDDYEEHPSHDGRHMALLSGEHMPDMDYSTFTPRYSRAGSRAQSRVVSRVPSARTSRRGSRVGSRAELIMTAGLRTPGGRRSFDLDDSMFEESPVEADFVEADEEDEGDEEEIARLARDRGFGLGTWVDRLMGWTLFSVDEDGEESSDGEYEDEDGTPRPENMTKEELKLLREVEAKRRKLEREAIIAAAAVQAPHRSNTGEDDAAAGDKPPPGEEGGGWADAAWLVSIAAKVLL
ncbi:hypothetical protein P171DRAFT_475330 [Karstenula rhodostoma CBS 690.94]|uniref:DUF3984 domain-containing protein n=1 Tax=Karstenula rhodostoma CBS 690.94 TaxID=1392251 RepID=A0A9P4UA66_9PLEO|nr:hypothetical protein P171DRAFT_475330 [Karstenula rhodostoma CBS 690.94]